MGSIGGTLVSRGWYGVDFDGTLAIYPGTTPPHFLGDPVKPMVSKVLDLLNSGREVRLVTARARDGAGTIAALEAWCQEHLGRVIPITDRKDYGMIELWDDRARQVIENTGEFA